jgi:hypothetical protein
MHLVNLFNSFNSLAAHTAGVRGREVRNLVVAKYPVASDLPGWSGSVALWALSGSELRFRFLSIQLLFVAGRFDNHRVRIFHPAVFQGERNSLSELIVSSVA